MSDILDIAFDIHAHRSRRNLEAKIEPIQVLPISQQSTQFYMRIFLKDHAGALEEMSHLFKQQDISIRQLIQKQLMDDVAEVVVITDVVCEADFNLLKDALSESASIASIESIIRVGL